LKKQVYKIDLQTGFILDILIAEFNDEGIPIEELDSDIITASPLDGLYRAKWTGSEWVEDMSQEDIDKLNLVDVDSLKLSKIAESKTSLESFLANKPLKYTDGLYYSVTKDKQNLLSMQFMTYMLEQQAGLTPVLKWNSTGDVCKEWTYKNLVGLSLAIKTYVKPYVSKQQELERQINTCTTKSELDGIVIDYETIA
jgi:hypothetical protein